MLIRALFWIAVVSILMPHASDWNAGRTAAEAAGRALRAAAPEPVAGSTSRDADFDSFGALAAAFDRAALRNLAEVKAEIEEQERRRAAHAG